MKVVEFIKCFQDKKIMNSKATPNAVKEYIMKTLEVKTYLPFNQRRKIAELIVSENTKEVDGIKRHNSIDAYISFIVHMLTAHTNLEFSNNPVEDYDLLSSSGLLQPIIETFQNSYNECDVLLKMTLELTLEDNNVNILVGKFLNSILVRLDIMADAVKEAIGNSGLQDIFGANFSEEDLAALSSMIDKLK